VKRLYLQLYLTVVLSLLVFALVAGYLWRVLVHVAPPPQAAELAGEIAQGALPPPEAPRGAPDDRVRAHRDREREQPEGEDESEGHERRRALAARQPRGDPAAVGQLERPYPSTPPGKLAPMFPFPRSEERRSHLRDPRAIRRVQRDLDSSPGGESRSRAACCASRVAPGGGSAPWAISPASSAACGGGATCTSTRQR